MMRKVRLSIVLGIVALTGIAITAMFLKMTEVATGATTGIVALLPKILESEEATG